MGSLNDNRKTPSILVSLILPYLRWRSVIWCPFDTEDSQFVKVLSKAGHQVIPTHIDHGQDFFNTQTPPLCDYIVSNPPFSRKLDVFQELFSRDLPFAMLMNLEILNYQEVGNFFYRHGEQLQLLIPDKKVSFDGHTSSFNTSYFCYRFLPKDLMFCHLPHNNTGKNFKMEELKR